MQMRFSFGGDVGRRLAVVAFAVVLGVACQGGSGERGAADSGSGSMASATARRPGDPIALHHLLTKGRVVDYAPGLPTTTEELASAVDVIVEGTIDSFVDGPRVDDLRDGTYLSRASIMWVDVSRTVKGSPAARVAVLFETQTPADQLDAVAPTDRPVLLYLYRHRFAEDTLTPPFSTAPSPDPEFNPDDSYFISAFGFFVSMGTGVGDVVSDHFYAHTALSSMLPSPSQPILLGFAADPNGLEFGSRSQ